MSDLIDRDALLSQMAKCKSVGELTAKSAIRMVRNEPTIGEEERGMYIQVLPVVRREDGQGGSRMTDREKAIVSAFTGIAMLAGDKFSIFHEYIEEKLGRPVWTHELADKDVWAKIKEASMEDFIALCKEENSLQKPLTLEETCSSKEPCVYLEMRDDRIGFRGYRAAYSGSHVAYVNLYERKENEIVYRALILDIGTLFFSGKDYGDKWRCWATKPTEEEREAAMWE